MGCMSSLNHKRKHPNPEKVCSCVYRVIFVLLLFLLYPYYNLSTEKVEFSHVYILAVLTNFCLSHRVGGSR